MVVGKPGPGPGVWLSHINNNNTIIDTDKKMVPRATLISQPNSHPFQDRHLSLEKPEKIGRSVARSRPASNNALFDCKVLSRNHALLWFNDGKFYLQDTNSSNGTFVNNQRLGKNAEDSPPREVCSGDSVQFGIDIMEVSKKVTHGGIMGTLRLYHPDGTEAKNSTPPSTVGCSIGTVQSSELYTLQQALQEAVQREQTLEQKLSVLQRLLDSVQSAADSSWHALIDEDRLMNKLEILQAQNTLYSKNFAEDKLREEISHLQDEKEAYQMATKECLKKVLHDKLDAVRKLQEVERALSTADSESARQQQLRQLAVDELLQLAGRFEEQLQQQSALQLQLDAAEEQLQRGDEEAVQERDRSRTQSVHQLQRIESLQTDNSALEQQLDALRDKLIGLTPDGDLIRDCGSGVMSRTESELSELREQVDAARHQLDESQAALHQLNEDVIKAEGDVCMFRERSAELDAHLDDVRREAVEGKELVRQLEDRLAESEAELQRMPKSSGRELVIQQDPSVERLELQVESIKESLSDARLTHAACEGRLERCQSDLLVARNNAQEATLRVDHLRSQIAEAESLCTRRSSHADQLQVQLIRFSCCVKEAGDQLQLYRDQLQQYQQSAVERDACEKQLQELACTAELKLTQLTEERDSLAAQLTELRAELVRSRDETRLRQEQLDGVSLRLTATTNNIELKPLPAAAGAVSTSPTGGDTAASSASASTSSTAGARMITSQQDDREKEDLRRQLRQLQQHNPNVYSYNVVAAVVLILALFVGFLLMNS